MVWDFPNGIPNIFVIGFLKIQFNLSFTSTTDIFVKASAPRVHSDFAISFFCIVGE